MVNQSAAVWLLIVLALITANLPFLIERPLLVLPWRQPGEGAPAGWLRKLESLAFFAVMAAVAWGVVALFGRNLLGLPLNSGMGFLLVLAGGIGVPAAVLAYPGWRFRSQAIVKPFFSRLIEVLVLYFLLGALGLAFEAYLGNPFRQTWEFVVITLCLFIVLGYPGFVYRYLFRRPRKKAGPVRSASPRAGRSGTSSARRPED